MKNLLSSIILTIGMLSCASCTDLMKDDGSRGFANVATIVGDALEKLMNGEKEFDAVKYMGQHRMAFAELNNMYMTGKDIDSVIKRVSYTVSEGINIAMEKNWV